MNARPANQLRRQPHRIAKPEAQHVAVEVQRLRIVAGGQHHVTQALLLRDELMPVRTHHASVLQRRPVEDFEAVAGRILEPDHLIDAAIGQLGGGGFLVRNAFEVQPVANLLQPSGISAFPARLQQPVALARHDHQPRRKFVHSQIQRPVGGPLALDHAEHLQAVLAPRRDIRGFDPQITQ
jgi:hypothetical protein